MWYYPVSVSPCGTEHFNGMTWKQTSSQNMCWGILSASFSLSSLFGVHSAAQTWHDSKWVGRVMLSGNQQSVSNPVGRPSPFFHLVYNAPRACVHEYKPAFINDPSKWLKTQESLACLHHRQCDTKHTVVSYVLVWMWHKWWDVRTGLHNSFCILSYINKPLGGYIMGNDLKIWLMLI